MCSRATRPTCCARSMMRLPPILYIGRVPHFSKIASPQRVRGDIGAGAGQRVRPAVGVPTPFVPPRDMDMRRRGIRPVGARHRLLGRAAPLHRMHRSRARSRNALRRRDRHSRSNARARRRQSGRGHSGRDQVRDGWSRAGRARAGRAIHSAERARVGRPQLFVRLRSGRHAAPTHRVRSRRA
jgi:hypothetical protein